MSIFSTLNNISLHLDLTAICSITGEETDTQMQPDVKQLAYRYKYTPQESWLRCVTLQKT